MKHAAKLLDSQWLSLSDYFSVRTESWFENWGVKKAAWKGREPCFSGADLRHEELGDSFRQFALLARQDHLQHVAVQLLHDDKHPLRRLKHALQVNDTRVMQILQRNRSKASNEEYAKSKCKPVTNVMSGFSLNCYQWLPVIWRPHSAADSPAW